MVASIIVISILFFMCVGMFITGSTRKVNIDPEIDSVIKDTEMEFGRTPPSKIELDANAEFMGDNYCMYL